MDLLKHYIKIGSFEDVKTIISNDFKFDTERTDYILLKTSLLHKNKEITKLLIEHNFRLNKSSLRKEDTTPLHLAVNLDWKDIVHLLLRKGASVAVRESPSGMTSIQLSFFLKNYELTDLMLPYDKSEGLYDTEHFIRVIPHLHIAAARNCVNIVNKHLQMGKDINFSLEDNCLDWPEYTPLHFAMQFQCKETVELLLEWGADITAQDKRGNTPLHLAAMLQNNSFIDLFLSKHKYSCENPKNVDGLSHFHIACTRNDVNNVYGFLQCGVDINAKVSESAQMFPGFIALHFALTNQCTDVVNLLLSNNTIEDLNSEVFLIDVNKTKNSEITNLIFSENIRLSHPLHNDNVSPLLKACLRRQREKIKCLINSISVNDCLSADSSRWPGATALHIIVECSKFNENEDIIKLLLDSGADITRLDARGKTPLHIAFQIHNYAEISELLESLLDQYSKVKINFVVDKDGLSNFHIACTCTNALLVEEFLNAGADVNLAVSSDSVKFPGYTPLHFAVTYRLPDVVDKLLARDANITIKNGLGMTAFDLLLETWENEGHFLNESHQIIASILKSAHERGIDNEAFDSRGFTLLHIAAMTGNEEMLKSCIDRQKVNIPVDPKSALYPGYTALHFAVLISTDKMLRMMLDHGADPAARTVDGSTPLHLALYSPGVDEQNNIDIDDGSRFDLSSAYDDRLVLFEENPYGRDGFSHFHVACQLGKIDIVKAFLDRGLDVDLKSKMPDGKYFYGPTLRAGETGLHVAVRTNNLKLTRLLLERGADVNARDALFATPLHKSLDDNGPAMKMLLEHGALVDARNSDGDTSLHGLCRENGWPLLVNLLLGYGADIRIKNKIGKTALDEACCFEPKYDVNSTMINHSIALFEARGQVNDSINFMCDFHEEHYRNQCKTELNNMELFMRNVLREDAHKLRLLVVNEVFQRAVDEVGTARNRYPIYGYLLKAQYRRGMMRRRLLEETTWALRQLGSRRLSTDGAEVILQYLTDEELVHLAQAVNV